MAIFTKIASAINDIFFNPKNNNEINITQEDDCSDREIISANESDCISSDFNDEMLMLEMMKLGYDPSSYTKDQMIEIIFDKMNKNKPLVADSNTQNSLQTQQI